MADSEHKRRLTDRAAREHLKQIFKLEEREGPREGPVTMSELAHALGHTAPAVTDMAKKLAERGLVDYVPYRGVRLTSEGRREATRALRRHRIVERFLTDMLGFPWQDAHEMATQFEHELPDKVEERLFKALNRPDICPHGFPIPQVPEESFPAVITLSELSEGQESVVATVLEEGHDILSFIDSLGLRPGARVEVQQRMPFDGPIVLRVDGVERTIGHNLGEIVTVYPITEGAAEATSLSEKRRSTEGPGGADGLEPGDGSEQAAAGSGGT